MQKLILMLRWILGIGCVFAISVFVLILVVGKGFEAFRSGAESANLMRQLLTITIPLLLVAMLVSVLMPGVKVLLNVLAIAVVLVCLSLIPVVMEHTVEGLLYLGFMGMWLLYYWLLTSNK